MSGGYKTPAKDDADAVKRKIESHSDAIDILQRPTAAQLLKLVANLIVPQNAVGSTTTAFTLTTSFQQLVSCVFTVPTGCTRAQVTVSANVCGSTASTAGDVLTAACTIGASSGPFSTGNIPSSSAFASVAAFHTLALTGLVAGATITCWINAKLTFNSGVTAFPESAVIVGNALFLP